MTMVAAVLEQLCKKRGVSRKDLVNEALRRGFKICPLDKLNAIISRRIRLILVVQR